MTKTHLVYKRWKLISSNYIYLGFHGCIAAALVSRTMCLRSFICFIRSRHNPNGFVIKIYRFTFTNDIELFLTEVPTFADFSNTNRGLLIWIKTCFWNQSNFCRCGNASRASSSNFPISHAEKYKTNSYGLWADGLNAERTCFWLKMMASISFLQKPCFYLFFK